MLRFSSVFESLEINEQERIFEVKNRVDPYLQGEGLSNGACPFALVIFLFIF